MQTFLQDLRYALRLLRKSPGFTLVAVLSLALGIGANTSIFSLVNATLLSELPVAEPDELVSVYSGVPGSPYSTASYPDYAEFRDQNRVFEGLACFGGIAASLSDRDQTDQIAGLIVSGNYFDVLGVRAAIGRTFSAEEDSAPDAHPVVVIGHGLWQRKYGGDRNVIGQQITLNGRDFTVIGVAPAGFNGISPGATRDIFVPMMMQALMRPPRGGYSGEMNPDLLKVRGNRWLWMVGRLKPGATIEQAHAEISVIVKQQEQAYPETNRNRIATLTLASLGDPTSRDQVVSVAALLMGIVGIVLLIACANVANLLLARATSRRKEIAVRLALGAGRWRLVRQLLTESLLLSLLGGVIGLLLALWAVDVLKATPPPAGMLPFSADFKFDGRVLGFTFVLSMLTGVVFGLAPALESSRPDLVPALKDETALLDQKSRRLSLRNALVIAQVALSLVLLVGAGLFLRSLWEMRSVSVGFDAEKLLSAPLNINLLRYTSAQGREFYRQVIERVEELPGVESATVARIVPLSGGGSVRSLLIEGQAGTNNDFRSEGAGLFNDNPNVIAVNTVGPSYFQTLGIALLRGRDFSSKDAPGAPPVVIASEAFVRRHFAEQEPLGKRLSLRGERGPWLEIVGVVKDSKYQTVSEGPTPFLYLPVAQNHETGMTLLVRSSGEPASIASAIRGEIQSLEKNLPVTGIRPMTELINGSLYAPRMGAILIAIFGAIALVLASFGLYGVMSFSVSRRTREIGVRVALGAERRDVLSLVMKEGLLLVGTGMALGLSAAVAATRLLESFLYGVSTIDAPTFAGVAVILASVALVACYIPARRATKVDPIVALRYE